LAFHSASFDKKVVCVLQSQPFAACTFVAAGLYEGMKFVRLRQQQAYEIQDMIVSMCLRLLISCLEEPSLFSMAHGMCKAHSMFHPVGISAILPVFLMEPVFLDL
jgi:hypothetical protein